MESNYTKFLLSAGFLQVSFLNLLLSAGFLQVSHSEHSTLLLDHSLMRFSSLDIILWHSVGFILGVSYSIQQPWSSLAIICEGTWY